MSYHTQSASAKLKTWVPAVANPMQTFGSQHVDFCTGPSAIKTREGSFTPPSGRMPEILGANANSTLITHRSAQSWRFRQFACLHRPKMAILALTPNDNERHAVSLKRGRNSDLEMPRRRQVLDAASLGEMIRSRREQLGLAQLELAAMVGIDAGNLSKIETGSRRAQIDTYLRLCGTVGIDIFAELRP